MKERNDIDRILKQLDPPDPPRDLRSRAIGSACAAMAANSSDREGFWSRTWCHAGLRAAWCSVVGVLVLAHVYLSLNPSGPWLEKVTSTEIVVAEVAMDAEIEEIAKLPRVGPDPFRGLDG